MAEIIIEMVLGLTNNRIGSQGLNFYRFLKAVGTPILYIYDFPIVLIIHARMWSKTLSLIRCKLQIIEVRT